MCGILSEDGYQTSQSLTVLFRFRSKISGRLKQTRSLRSSTTIFGSSENLISYAIFFFPLPFSLARPEIPVSPPQARLRFGRMIVLEKTQI
ncbi:hypothetical protein CKAN_00526100 [Cinnamomum micranthum f. kanehirae]|uniref:Uncharacterized protein n=1 Tax=Cinnamomum micranthum f. kanehirae TaxID=337451 RepID=A0A3S4NG82_9MAGN|nr:hypothetical protein CKAN_00526100 [Cinnamomum micranthum f. kanehirae]